MTNTNTQIASFTNVLIDRVLASERLAADHKNDLFDALAEIQELRAKIADFEALLNSERQTNAKLLDKISALEEQNAVKPSIRC